jgi:hypothetical protein
MNNFNLEQSQSWILTSELKKQEISERTEGIDNANLKSDFGSYKALLNRRNSTMIELHNSVGVRSKLISAHLKSHIIKYCKKPMVIGDMGCGAGFIANDLKKMLNFSDIYAYDISEDAIAYAKLEFPSVNFEAKSIEPDSDFGLIFDVIYAHEFYPFTRTNSFEFQSKYIDNFLKNIDFKNSGLLMISMLQTEKCLINNYDKLLNHFGIKYHIQKVIIPSLKIYIFFKNYTLSSFLTKLLNFILKRKNAYIIIIRNKT